jgi:hypothetical protein
MAKRKSSYPKNFLGNFFEEHNYYTPSRDGTLEQYLESHDGTYAFPLFKGYEHYKLLWNDGWIQPEVTAIRLMWNVGRGDEYLGILDKDTCVGIQLPAHSGRPGNHSIKEILSDSSTPCWEISTPRPKTYRDKELKKPNRDLII